MTELAKTLLTEADQWVSGAIAADSAIGQAEREEVANSLRRQAARLTAYQTPAQGIAVYTRASERLEDLALRLREIATTEVEAILADVVTAEDDGTYAEPLRDLRDELKKLADLAHDIGR